MSQNDLAGAFSTFFALVYLLANALAALTMYQFVVFLFTDPEGLDALVGAIFIIIGMAMFWFVFAFLALILMLFGKLWKQRMWIIIPAALTSLANFIVIGSIFTYGPEMSRIFNLLVLFLVPNILQGFVIFKGYRNLKTI
ncbi:MAG: hypothetical protein INQ03_08230 [Candidatus Heimdallarchaeota archaeon]|nr:hypothetical protein [Candidatus Heimdallarchaeota archaeon]